MFQRLARPIYASVLAFSLGLVGCGATPTDEEELPKKNEQKTGGGDIGLKNPPPSKNPTGKEDSDKAEELGLIGKYASRCLEDQNGIRFQYLMEWAPTMVAEYLVLYHSTDDRQCSSFAVAIVHASSYKIGKETDLGFQEVDLTEQFAQVQLFQQKDADEFNKTSAFGYTDWKIEEWKDVTDRPQSPDDKPIGVKGTKSYLVYGVEKNVIYQPLLTEEKKGETPETRPTQVRSNVPMQRIKEGTSLVGEEVQTVSGQLKIPVVKF
ncbi:MAG: hypothetical protein AB7T49_04715 [Oligoflexales bacterium]